MITASIVIYKTSFEQINAVLKSISDSKCVSILYIIDNCSIPSNKEFFDNYSCNYHIEYIPHNNTGYGASHNIALKKAIEIGSDYHLILNPDIYFDSNCLAELTNFMNLNKDVGSVMPKVTYPNGNMQYLCKLLPKPADLIIRRFFHRTKLINKKNIKYELRSSGYDKLMNPPCLSGCFMFMRLSTLKENNLFFDESFFMYCEDFDLIRRIHRVAKTIYYPCVTIIHAHSKESYKNVKMEMIHIKSAIKYFNKWGWFFDKERNQFNKQILDEINMMNS